MSRTEAPLLDVRKLSIEFHSGDIVTRGLQDVSFHVNPGETVAIVGESGSGKSITSLSILQLLPSPPARITNGQILFSAANSSPVDLLRIPESNMKRMRGNEISMIFQEPMTSLNPVFTIGNQVQEAILLHQRINKKQAKQKTIELFNQVQLPDPANIIKRYPHELSGGQRQRVMIAMAMSCEPALLIADEPTTALDVTVQKAILGLIRQLQLQSAMSVIFITHDLGIVSEIADRIIVMYKGKILEQGSAREILHAPSHPYTRSLLACRPQLHRKGERLPTVSDYLTIKEDGSIVAKATANIPGAHDTRDHSKQGALKKTSSTPLLTVKDLDVSFPLRKNILGKTLEHLKAVDDVSFEVYEGETLGLVGESGCGKSTLGRAILHLIKPSAGSIKFHGREISSLNEQQLRALRKDLQIVFQDPYSSLNPRLTAGKALLEPLTVHRLTLNNATRRSRVSDLLKKVDLKEDHFYRYPHEFSGGQRQRIVIARALALSPSFVICDESVSSLDVSVQAQVLNLLNELKRELGFTMIFISHDLSVVRYLSDRIMVMQKGKIIESGPAEEIYLHPKNEYTKKLISAIPKITA